MTTIKQIVKVGALGGKQVRKLTDAERKARDAAHKVRMERYAARAALRK